MQTKIWYRSKRVWSIVATLAVVVARQFLPEQAAVLDTIQAILIGSGLWFTVTSTAAVVLKREERDGP